MNVTSHSFSSNYNGNWSLQPDTDVGVVVVVEQRVVVRIPLPVKRNRC